MKKIIQVLAGFASVLCGGTMLGTGCTNKELIWPSIRDGLFGYISTSINNPVDSALLSDFIVNTFIDDANEEGGD
jgi:hypothetical protein